MDEKEFFKSYNFNKKLKTFVQNFEKQRDSISTAQSQLGEVKNEITVSLNKMIENINDLKVEIK